MSDTTVVEELSAPLAALRATEQALRESSELLRVTLSSIGDGVVTSDVDGRVVFINAAAERLTGWSREDAVGRVLADVIRIVTEDTRAPLPGPIEMALHMEPPVTRSGRVLLLARDGRETVVEKSVAPIRDEEGQLFGVVLVLRDMSERQNAERAREQLAAIVESSQDAIISKDVHGRIQSWNAAACRLYEYTEAEAIGQSITMLIPPERADEETIILRRLLRGERIDELETVRVSKSGRRIPVAITVSPMLDEEGHVIGASKIARDIGPRLRAEALARFVGDASAVLSERAGDEHLLARIGELAVLQFADWCVIHRRAADGSFERLAVARGETRGATTDAALPLPTDTLLDVANDVITNGKTVRNDEAHVLPPGIRSFISSPLSSRAGTLGVISFLRKEDGEDYDQADVAAAEELARRVAIAVENSSLLAELKESDRRKDEFLAMLAHELRNPLAPLRNALHILRLKGPALPELQWAREIMDRQLNQLNRLVDDLLDVSRIASGRIELRRERIQLELVVQNALEASRPLIEAMKHEITVSMPDGPLEFEADMARLAQVLSNLLNNAAKYTPHGGQIALDVRMNDDEVVFIVSDNGIGISVDMLPRIFDMFTQADRSMARSQGGLGIGLTLVQLLVSLHGGTVTARSAGLGEGSVFEVRLPVGEPYNGNSRRRALGTKELLAGVPARRVLVVDDNHDAAESLAMLLEMAGSVVHTAFDGPDAVDAVPAFRPDIILLDIGLPSMSGYDVCRQIRQEHGADITLVALTGWGQHEDRSRARESGFDHHLTKPITIDGLRAVLTGKAP